MRECKKCLLKELSDLEYYRSVKEYVENLPDDLKAEEGLYESRLFICRGCDNLVNGICRLCGCFVEARAAKKENHCALSLQMW